MNQKIRERLMELRAQESALQDQKINFIEMKQKNSQQMLFSMLEEIRNDQDSFSGLIKENRRTRQVKLDKKLRDGLEATHSQRTENLQKLMGRERLLKAHLEALKENIEIRAGGKVPGFEKLGQCLWKKERDLENSFGHASSDFFGNSKFPYHRSSQNQNFKLNKKDFKNQVEQINQRLKDLEIGQETDIINIAQIRKLKSKLGFKNSKTPFFNQFSDSIPEISSYKNRNNNIINRNYTINQNLNDPKRRTIPKKTKTPNHFAWQEERNENIMTNSKPVPRDNQDTHKEKNGFDRERLLRGLKQFGTEQNQIYNQEGVHHKQSELKFEEEEYHPINERTKKSRKSGNENNPDSKISNFTHQKQSENSDKSLDYNQHSENSSKKITKEIYKNKTQNFSAQSNSNNIRRNSSLRTSNENCFQFEIQNSSESKENNQKPGMNNIGQVVSIFKRSKKMVQNFKKKKQKNNLEIKEEITEENSQPTKTSSERRRGLLVSPPLATTGRTSDRDMEDLILNTETGFTTPVGNQIAKFSQKQIYSQSQSEKQKQNESLEKKSLTKEIENIESGHNQKLYGTQSSKKIIKSQKSLKRVQNSESQNPKSNRFSKKSQKNISAQSQNQKQSVWEEEEDDFGDLDSCFASSLDFGNSKNQSNVMERKSSQKFPKTSQKKSHTQSKLKESMNQPGSPEFDEGLNESDLGDLVQELGETDHKENQNTQLSNNDSDEIFDDFDDF